MKLEALKQARKDSRLSITQLAERAGVARSTVWEAEVGRKDPTLESTVKIARALGVEVEDLIAAPRARECPQHDERRTHTADRIGIRA